LLLGLTMVLAVTPVSTQPAGAWRQYLSLAEAGFDPEAMAGARAYAEKAGSDAVLVVHDGHVAAAWGDPARRFKTYSVRKSLLSLMFGAPSVARAVRLDARLADLQIDEREPLSVGERSATVAHLLSARSGIYLPAAREPASMTRARPARGSAAPGQSWFYNNWDFNALGTIYETFAGVDVFTGFRDSLAAPLGMEDYRARDGYPVREPSRSKHAAYEFHLSARDLARIGQLVLQNGVWNGRSLVTREWLAESLRIRTRFPQGGGYGYLWWIDAGRFRTEGRTLPALDATPDIAATGAGEQLLLIIPELKLVIVHLNQDETLDGEAFELAELIVQARRGAARPNAARGAVSHVPLPNVPEPPPERTAVPFTRDPREYAGTYDLTPTLRAMLRAVDDGLFIEMPGRGEAELFQEAADRFFLKVADVTLHFERDQRGRVVSVRVVERGRSLTGRRAEL
jgi:CubicO group peptidase (beta-lactamase class C family)